MTTSSESVPTHDPLAADLTPAGARIQLDEWNRHIPPRRPIVPHIRIGKRWINVLWAVPIAAAALIVMIAVAQNLREIPAVQAFLERYPGVPQGQPAVSRLSRVAAHPALLEHVLHVLHHARWYPDPGRSPAALLEPRLHPRNRVAPVLASRAGVPHVDRQGRRRHAARLAWHPGPAPFHWART